MTQLIFGKDEELARWAEAVYPAIAPLSRPLTTIGIASNEGRIIAVAIFHEFRYPSIEISFIASSPLWSTKSNIRAIFAYPFRQLGVRRMTAITEKTNKRARKLLSGLGFRHEGTHPFAAKSGGTMCTYGLYEKVVNERWLSHVA